MNLGQITKDVKCEQKKEDDSKRAEQGGVWRGGLVKEKETSGTKKTDN